MAVAPCRSVPGVGDVLAANTSPAPATVQTKKNPPKKLSYMEDRELKILEDSIPVQEEEIAALEDRFSHPESFSDPVREMRELTEQLNALRAKLEQDYARWEELSTKLENLG